MKWCPVEFCSFFWKKSAWIAFFSLNFSGLFLSSTVIIACGMDKKGGLD